VYEINTWPWLRRLSALTGRPVDLASVPAAEWDALAAAGFDVVWLMGVWERSPAGTAIALGDDGLVASFESALPGHSPDDVVGSPYCVRNYRVDDQLGGPDGLAAARDALAARGVGVLLDFVPNHVAPDHPWTTEHPERLIQGTPDDLAADPVSFIEVDGRVFANGRDPFFAAWRDVVQVNAFSDDLRAAAIDTIRTIGEQCDGVRCDMAMLMMNDTFERTWGERAGPRPADDYWPTVIPAVRERHEGFRFIAEAYWDLEHALQEQGFDYCYDKRLYDRLLEASPEEVRLHLLAGDEYQAKLLRFIENHDEPRIASVVDTARHKALAVATFTQAGATLVHDGEAEGATVRLPVFLDRYPDEPADDDLASFYASMWSVLRDRTFREGRWHLCTCVGWDGNDTSQNIVTWGWDGDNRWLVVVNLSDSTAAGEVATGWDDLRGHTCRLVDDTNGTVYDRAGSAVCDGRYVELGPWAWHLFRVDVLEEQP
jgi:glycosidase